MIELYALLEALHRCLPGIREALGGAWGARREQLEAVVAALEADDVARAERLLDELVDELKATPARGLVEEARTQARLAGGKGLTPLRTMHAAGPTALERLRSGIALVDAGAEAVAEAAERHSGGSRPPPPSPDALPADCTVFGPASVHADSFAILQVWVYPPMEGNAVREEAREADSQATRRAFQSLDMQLEPGTRLDVRLEIDGLDVEEPDRTMIWSGRRDVRQFVVTTPRRIPVPRVLGRVSVAARGVPVGTLRFVLDVAPVGGATRPEDGPHVVPTEAVRYERGFVCYSSADRPEVLRRVQGMKAAGISVFQDILELDPGDRWERRLYEEIDHCDVFFLFWSKAASASEWVQREIEHALDRQRASPRHLPEMKPVPIEGPPIPDPPPSLRHVHFNDALLAHLRASEPVE